MAQTTAGGSAGQARRLEPALPVAIYNRWCKGCGICIEFCPRKVLALSGEGKAVVSSPDKCTRCRLCEILCPDFAITVTPVAETMAPYGPGGEPVARGRAQR